MRAIRLHDTRSGELVELARRPGESVGIYACGPTVYGRIHIGNARPYVVFSLLKRFLEHEGYEVALVANITDVNDKIYEAASAAGGASVELAAEMIVYFRVRSDAAYGSLSHRRLEDMDQGEGVEGAQRKQDPVDFALWKANKPGE